MHASDRYLAPGATLDDLRTGDGATGYASALKHGETGKGMNDYDAIFRILARASDFDGWISIEDGMNGLEEIARSAEFLEAETRAVLETDGHKGKGEGDPVDRSPGCGIDWDAEAVGRFLV